MELSGLAAALALLTVGTVMATALAETNGTGADLDCTNDFDELMFCQFKAQNCARHSLTLRSLSGYGERRCDPQACDAGLCCCTVQMGGELLILHDNIKTTVWKDAQMVESKVIGIKESIKTKAPTIVSVKKSNGNFQLRWKTNVYNYLATNLAASVTYYKAGSTEKVTAFDELATVDGLGYWEIPGRDLEPSTTYVVSVRSYTNWSERYSDSSNEWTFTTGMSPHTVSLAIIVSLSVFAVALTAGIYRCYAKLKQKWWDTVASPKLLMHPKDIECLKPEPVVVSSVDVIPASPDEGKSCSKGLLPDSSSESSQQSSGINTGSSCLSYATTEPADILARVQKVLNNVFPNISPVSPVTHGHLLDSAPSSPFDTGSASSGSFDNRTYSIVVPSDPQPMATGGSAYQPVGGDTEACVDQQVRACWLFNLPLQASPVLPTDMSYQQCKADSAYAEDSSLSSVSSDSTAAALSTTDEAAVACDGNPCRSRVPAGPGGALPVDVTYQAFQKLVGQPDVWLPGQRSAGNHEPLDKRPEKSLTTIPAVIPAFVGSLPGGHCLPELRTPLTSATSSHRPIITNSGYQSK